jgi:acylphosphatase
MLCKHLIISGRVQGVWFRESMRIQADQIGITGWVRNLSDGRVEAVVCGPSDNVDLIVAWARKGPRLAHVLDVEITPAEGAFDGFEKR